ncbi:hypothetical protein D3C81_2236450 [compost metagenome]
MERTHDPIAHFEVVDARADGQYLAGAIAGGDQPLEMRHWILIAKHRDVSEVEGHGMNAN